MDMKGLGAATVIIALANAASATAGALPPTTPPGVTLVEVARDLTLSQPDILWTRPGDAAGRTLLYSANDRADAALCADACAQEFPPLLAMRGAKASGDWTLVRRGDGAAQWAYQGHPLYTWAKEQEPGEVAVNVGMAEAAGAKLAERKINGGNLLPPPGWTVARFTPEATVTLPAGINVKLVGAAEGVALTDYEGFTLYAFDGDVKRDNQSCSERGCMLRWIPLAAADFAHGVGDFSVIVRADGSAQWAYKTHPLYRFSGDLRPGDVLGAAADKHWTVAALAENFHPAQVAVAHLEAYGNSLTVKGRTLYGGYVSQKRWGGRNTQDGFRNSWSKGLRLGTAACGDAKCLADWHPFAAPANAEASGFWQIYTRPDGSRQWAYKGYALWTHAADKTPGDMTGQLTYDYAKLGGDAGDLKRMAFLDKVGGDLMYGGGGIYWSLARP